MFRWLACRILCGVDGPRGAGWVIRPGAITVQDTADGQVLHLSGDVDAVVVKAAEAARPLDLSRVVAVDVGDLIYIDSTGLSLLVRWAQEAAAAGRSAEIRRGTLRFDRVLAMAGLSSFFTNA